MTPASRAQGWRRLGVVLASALAADQLAKAVLVAEIDPGERVEVLPFLDLVHVLNEGVAFGLLGDSTRGVVLGFTIVALVLVAAWFARDARRPLGWLAVGLLAGGALGNLADRLFRDAVVDFIDLPAWPSFNLADIAITAGAAMLVWTALAGDREEGDDG